MKVVRNPSLDDAEVVRRVLAGERELFEVLVRRHDARVYRTVRAMLRDEDEVEDAMQAAWVSAYQHLGDFAGAAAFSTWLVRIAANEALGRLRGRTRLVRADDGEERRRDRIRGRRTRRSARRLARRCGSSSGRWTGSPRGYRVVFMLRDVEQLSTAETAEALGLREDAVKVRLHRARGDAPARARRVDRAGSPRGVPVPRPALQSDGEPRDDGDRPLPSGAA